MRAMDQLERVSRDLSRRLQSEFLIERTPDQVGDALLIQSRGYRGVAADFGIGYLSGRLIMERLIEETSLLLSEEK